MLTILVICGPAFVITAFMCWRNDLDDAGLVVICGLMAGLIAAIPTMPIAMYIGSKVPMELSQETIELVALSDSSELHGRIAGSVFAVAGRIDQEMHYAYYYRVGPESYRYRSVPTSHATIFEDEAERPYVKRFTKAPKPSLWGIQTDSGSWWEEIHIPKGSIVNDFSLDLK